MLIPGPSTDTFCRCALQKRTDQKTEKQRKKLAELESQLVTASPNLPFRVYSRSGKQNALFFLSSDFDRTQWQEAIHVLQVPAGALCEGGGR